MAEREPGPYWVRVDDDWSVAEWSGERWCQKCWGDITDDRLFDEIDERMLRREEGIKRVERKRFMRVWFTYADTAMTERRLGPVAPPRPITDAQKTGERFLVKYEGGAVFAWSIGEETRTVEIWLPLGWYSARWLRGCWKLHSEDDDRVIAFAGVATDYLPLPPDV